MSECVKEGGCKHPVKKIVLITCVKNECDIIETYCRYNLSFCDCLLIHENHKSSDNTREIVGKLIDEGLPIFFEAEGEDIYYEAAKNVLAEIAVEKYGADLVIQLDADEFLFHIDGINPREALERLEEDVEYQVAWRTYIYEREPDENAAFTLDNFRRYRNPALEEAQGHAGKAFASRYLMSAKGAKFTYGAHWLNYPDEHKETARVEVHKELICAHYPIRSLRQVMNKAIPNWINKWTLPENLRVPKSVLDAFQLGILFNSIKEHGELSADIMQEVSITYSLLNMGDKEKIDSLMRDLKDELTLEGEVNASFCDGRLASRYAPVQSSKDFLRAMLSTLEKALVHLDCESRSSSLQVFELTQHRISLRKRCDELALHIDILERQLADVYASKSWKVGHGIMKFVGFFAGKGRGRGG